MPCAHLFNQWDLRKLDLSANVFRIVRRTPTIRYGMLHCSLFRYIFLHELFSMLFNSIDSLLAGRSWVSLNFCPWGKTADSIVISSSIYSTLVLSVDRLWSVLRPNGYRTTRSTRITSTICGVTWICIATVSVVRMQMNAD